MSEEFNLESKINKERKSNLELLRIVCMILIIAHHCSVHGGSFAMEKMCANKIISVALLPFGKICFDAFLILSAWFLVEQNFKTERFLKIWLQTFFYSVIFSGVAAIFGTVFNIKLLISILFPIIGNSHGYASAYLAFYLCIPLLSLISRNMTKTQCKYTIGVLFVVEIASQIIGFYDGYTQKLSSELILFLFIYFIALYIKKWPIGIMKSKGILIYIFCMCWVIVFGVRFASIYIPQDALNNFFINITADESSITSIIGGVALFGIFNLMNIKSNKVINFIAKSSFGILLIHDHNIFRYVLWNNIVECQKWYYSNYFVVYLVATVFSIFFVGVIIDSVRRVVIEKPLFNSDKVKTLCVRMDNLILFHEENSSNQQQATVIDDKNKIKIYNWVILSCVLATCLVITFIFINLFVKM